MNLPESICMLPWMSIEASPTGTARPCCLAREDITGIDLRKNTIEDAYKSEYMQTMRQQMIPWITSAGAFQAFNS